jgi:hypothetical protein
MAHAYRPLFDEINRARKSRGEKILTWKQFITKEDPTNMIKKYRQQFKDVIPPDPPSKIVRPPAVYDNKSARDKYGL